MTTGIKLMFQRLLPSIYKSSYDSHIRLTVALAPNALQPYQSRNYQHLDQAASLTITYLQANHLHVATHHSLTIDIIILHIHN